jgi:hypothetical protein
VSDAHLLAVLGEIQRSQGRMESDIASVREKVEGMRSELHEQCDRQRQNATAAALALSKFDSQTGLLKTEFAPEEIADEEENGILEIQARAGLINKLARLVGVLTMMAAAAWAAVAGTSSR